jgi:RNA polymerase sigma factor (sigma-70 family)
VRARAGGRSEFDLVRVYLSEIGKYPLLSKDDEIRLSKAIEAGRKAGKELARGRGYLTADRRRELVRATRNGATAEREFVLSNLRLVVSIAKRYQGAGLPLLDLIQEGNLGLMHAIEKFDWRKGFKFSTYATWWIRQAMSRAIANTARTIRMPIHAAELLATVQSAWVRLEEVHHRRPTLAELVEATELSEARLLEVLQYRSDPASLSEPFGDDDRELGQVVEDRTAESPLEAVVSASLSTEVEVLLAVLDRREREVLRLRFGLDRGEPRTLDEVGEHFHLTRERIRQIEHRALSKLSHPSSSAYSARALIDG